MKVISRALAREMYEDLSGNRLEVILVPGTHDNGRQKRVAAWRNPWWYRRMCERHPRPGCKKAKMRTIIKRRHTLDVLRKIANGLPHKQGRYFHRLLDAAENYKLHLAIDNKRRELEKTGFAQWSYKNG